MSFILRYLLFNPAYSAKSISLLLYMIYYAPVQSLILIHILNTSQHFTRNLASNVICDTSFSYHHKCSIVQYCNISHHMHNLSTLSPPIAIRNMFHSPLTRYSAASMMLFSFEQTLSTIDLKEIENARNDETKQSFSGGFWRIFKEENSKNEF